ncbi:MAG: CRTAC1 family protein [Planctomycetes bacterium]|nr:CRTAC1 family protein [Planctomycetota bacterium]
MRHLIRFATAGRLLGARAAIGFGLVAMLGWGAGPPRPAFGGLDEPSVRGVEATPPPLSSRGVVADDDESPASPLPALRFSVERPIDFRHRKGDSGRRYLVETMGAGLALFDADGDGDLDLYLVQGRALPGAEEFDSRNRLYTNDGSGHFVDATTEHSAPDEGYGMGCAIGDIDNDGDPDLLVTNFGRNALFRNDGGRFVDITDEAGVGGGDRGAPDAWSSSAAFADFDGDGLLDLYVTTYLAFSIESHKDCTLGQGIPAYCSPDAYPGAPDHLYRNLGGGKFEDVSARAGLGSYPGKSLGVVCADFDDDGRVDIYVANDGVANQLLLNRGSWSFEDATLIAGVGYNDDGMAQAGMGIASGDLDGDGRLDLLVTNLSSETNVYYRALGSGFFEDATAPSGLGAPSFLMTGFGTEAADFDGDGDLDVFVANGHVIDNIAEFNDHQTYRQPDQLYLNDGRGRFTERTPAEWRDSVEAGRGAAVGDVDGDGDLDIVVSNCDGRPILYRNLRDPKPGSERYTIGLVLEGRSSNRDAIGARVEIQRGDERIVRRVVGGGSYLSGRRAEVAITIGGATIDRLTIRWPSGLVQTLEELRIDGALAPESARPLWVIREPEAK